MSLIIIFLCRFCRIFSLFLLPSLFFSLPLSLSLSLSPFASSFSEPVGLCPFLSPSFPFRWHPLSPSFLWSVLSLFSPVCLSACIYDNIPAQFPVCVVSPPMPLHLPECLVCLLVSVPVCPVCLPVSLFLLCPVCLLVSLPVCSFEACLYSCVPACLSSFVSHVSACLSFPLCQVCLLVSLPAHLLVFPVCPICLLASLPVCLV